MSSDTSRPIAGRQLVLMELGNDWLKIAEVTPSKGGVSISRLHLQKFDPAEGITGAAIGSAFDSLKLRGLPVVAYVPRQAVNIRMMELPSVNPDEIADMVDLQSGKQTPYSKDEIVSGYRLIGTGREGYTSIMLAIVQKSVVRQKFYLLEEAGVDVQMMSVSSEGLLNWYVADVKGDASATAVLDVDSYYSDFAVFSSGRMVYTRSILTGSNQLLGEYDKWKEKYAVEVLRSLEASRAEQPGLSVKKLLLTGAGPGIGELAATLGKQLGIPVESMDVLQNVKKAPASPSLKDAAFRGLSMTALIGMGMAPQNLEINLTPDSVMLRKDLMRRAKTLTAFGMLFMALLVAGSLAAVTGLFMKKAHLDQLSARYEAIASEAREIEKKEAVVNAAQKRADLKFSALSLLSEVHAMVPEGVVFLDSVDIDLATVPARVSLEGFGNSRQDVKSLVQNLEQSALFKNATEEGSTTQDARTGKFRFRVTCGLEDVL